MGVTRTCTHCGQINRIPSRHLADAGRCGKCKTELAALSEPLDVGAEEFREVVNHAQVPVLVDFWASWCGPCRMAAPHVKRVAQEMAGKAIVLKIDTEAHPDLANLFNVRGIPNFVVLKNGDIVRQQAGLVDHRQMRGWLEEAA